MKKVFNHNTHLGVNVKTVLNNDRVMKTGKDYQGVLRRDVEIDEFLYDEHFTFVETATHQTVRRNPRIFSGRYITVTRWADGSYQTELQADEDGRRLQPGALRPRRV